MSQSSHLERLTNFSLETPWRYVEGLTVSNLDAQTLHHLYEVLPDETHQFIESIRVCRNAGQPIWAALVSWRGMPVIPLGLQLHGQQVTNSHPEGFLIDDHGKQICQYVRLPSDSNQREIIIYGVREDLSPDQS